METLLVSGSVDSTTPARYAADELLPSLSKGKQVILSEFGHVDDVWNLQPEAAMYLLTTFYDTGEADDSLFTYQPMNFDVGFGFPAMAKLFVAVIVLLIALLVQEIFSQHSLEIYQGYEAGRWTEKISPSFCIVLGWS